MTDPMDDVDYDTKDFRVDEGEEKLPPWLTDSHFIYHLDQQDPQDQPREYPEELLCSPRKLSDMCMMEMVNDPANLYSIKSGDIPNDMYPALLTEAILNHELQSVFYLVSRWPLPVLDVMPLLPREENIGPKYLTQPLGDQSTMSLLDCFMHSLLSLKDGSPLRVVNFAGFKHDRKLSKELARLPLLWIHPEKRSADMIHGVLSKTIDVTMDFVEQYINKINCVYTNMDPHIKHGKDMEPVTIVLECRCSLDDVTVGLALQSVTPFRFACHRLWMAPTSDAHLSPTAITKVLQARDITHLEFINPSICDDPCLYRELLEGLLLLPNLVTLGLPDTVHTDRLHDSATWLNQNIRRLPAIRKLNLQSCNLKDNLESVLTGLQRIEYLNVSDCRLTSGDIEYLINWEELSTLKELNIGSNNFKAISSLCLQLLTNMSRVVCLGLSYSCFTDTGLKEIVNRCTEMPLLKVLSIQTFVPLSRADMELVLTDCAAMTSLQRCRILPEAYAFLGNNELERNKNRALTLQHGQTTLENLLRADIVLD